MIGKIHSGRRSGKTFAMMQAIAIMSTLGERILVITPKNYAPGYVAKDIRRYRDAIQARGCFTQTEILDESGGTVKVINA